MEQARVWYERAAEQGDTLAQFNLANMHYKGHGGPVSMEQARVWYGRAAEQGDVRAQFNIGAMHKNGDGGPKSYEHAIFWLKRAVAQGYNNAMGIVQDMESTCSSCGKRSASGENMKTCSGCKCAIYCSEVCQRVHWKKDGGHKTKCKKIHTLHLKMVGGASGSSGSAAGGAGESKTNGGDGGAPSAGGAVAAKTKKKKTKKKKK
jgi:hypothetical protein